MNQKKAGVIISYIGMAVNMLSGLIYTPIMLRLLGQSEYGLYQLVYSVVSYLSLLSLGFGSSYMRFYSREKARNNDEGIARINGMFLLIFCFMSIICIVCGIIMLRNIKMIFGNGLTSNEYKTASILMLLMSINLALTFPNSVFNCIITSQEKFLFQKTLSLFQYLLHPFITLPLLLAGYGSIGIVTGTTLLTVSVLISNVYYCLKKIHSQFCFSNLQFSQLTEMWVFTFFIFLNQIVDQINWSIDKFLLGRLSGTISVAIYGVGAQINSLYIQFSSAVSNVFIPKVNRIVAESGDNKELTELFTRVGRIQFIIMSLILTGFVFFGKHFIMFWAGNGYGESYIITLLLIIPVTIPLIQNLGIEIQRAKNKHKARSIVYFMIAIANILISIPLIKVFGPVGAAFGTTISLVVGNVLFMNWYYHKKLGIDIVYFWRHILQFSKAFVFPVLIGIIAQYCTYSNVAELVIAILIYSIVFCISMYLFGMNDEEKNIVNKQIRKLLKK